MDFVLESFGEAWRMIVGGDAAVVHALWVTVLCTTVAVGLAMVVAVPYGAWLGLTRRRGQGVQVMLLRIGLAFPTVVVGLLLYGLLSRRGPLGAADLLHTKTAISIGLFLLAFPVLGSVLHAAAASVDPVATETARTLGAGRLKTVIVVLGDLRPAVVAGFLAAFARCFTELGVATTVGGNIDLATRTLAGTAQLHLQAGAYALALAPGLVLLAVSVALTVLAHAVSREGRR